MGGHGTRFIFACWTVRMLSLSSYRLAKSGTLSTDLSAHSSRDQFTKLGSDDMVHLLLPNPPKVWPIVRATCRKGNARMGTASLTPSFQLGPPLSFRPLLVRTAFSFFGSQPSLGAISARQAFFGAVLIVGMAALATTVWFCPGAGGDLCILTGPSGVL